MNSYLGIFALLVPILSIVAGYYQVNFFVFIIGAGAIGAIFSFLMDGEKIKRNVERTNSSYAWMYTMLFATHSLIWSLFFGLGKIFS